MYITEHAIQIFMQKKDKAIIRFLKSSQYLSIQKKIINSDC